MSRMDRFDPLEECAMEAVGALLGHDKLEVSNPFTIDLPFIAFGKQKLARLLEVRMRGYSQDGQDHLKWHTLLLAIQHVRQGHHKAHAALRAALEVTDDVEYVRVHDLEVDKSCTRCDSKHAPQQQFPDSLEYVCDVESALRNAEHSTVRAAEAGLVACSPVQRDVEEDKEERVFDYACLLSRLFKYSVIDGRRVVDWGSDEVEEAAPREVFVDPRLRTFLPMVIAHDRLDTLVRALKRRPTFRDAVCAVLDTDAATMRAFVDTHLWEMVRCP